MREVVYIATPVRGDLHERRINRQRATLLAHLAAVEGLAPLLPLFAVATALEGYPDAETGDSAVPLACCLSLLATVKAQGGRFWVLERDDHTLSGGCAMELERWNRLLSVEGGTRQQTPVPLHLPSMGERFAATGDRDLIFQWKSLTS